MIEINLLPSAGKRSSRRGAGGAALSARLGELAARVRDPYLAAATASLVLAAIVVGALHLRHVNRVAELTEREQQAVQDSTRYAAVLREKRAAEAQRDSIVRQLEIIKSIDNDRFVWPHLMEEVSRALPAYTWLTELQQTSAVVSVAARPDSVAAGSTMPDPLAFRIIGNTVDIQALTRFMKLLEASPFIQNVQLARSAVVDAQGKQVTQFQLDAEYELPPPSAVRTVPVTLTVR
ncbi:MAG TPA: PilN domain-containing protein [Gemmatimonadaceae bacterium]|nr:PilN domain-containing protein [Gemmatimonadaceae bacterium]